MNTARKEGAYARVVVTLPKSVASQLRRYADAFRQGNMSGFVADAVVSHIQHLKKARNTARLRAAYAASSQTGRSIVRQWKTIDDEIWRRLDGLESASS